MNNEYPITLDKNDVFEETLLKTLKGMDKSIADLFWLRLAQSVIPRYASESEMQNIIKNVTKWALIPQTPQVFEENATRPKEQKTPDNAENAPTSARQRSANKVVDIKGKNPIKLSKHSDSLSEGLF